MIDTRIHESSIPSDFAMARWPDQKRSTLITVALIFGVFPLLAWLTWWFVRGVRG